MTAKVFVHIKLHCEITFIHGVCTWLALCVDVNYRVAVDAPAPSFFTTLWCSWQTTHTHGSESNWADTAYSHILTPPCEFNPPLSPLAFISLPFEPIITIQINSRVRVVYEELYFLHIVLTCVVSLSLHIPSFLLSFTMALLWSHHFCIHWFTSFKRTVTVCVPLCVVVCSTWPHMHTDEISCRLQPPVLWFQSPGTVFGEKTPQCVAPSSHVLSSLSPKARNTGYSANSSTLWSIIITLSLGCRRRSGATRTCSSACVVMLRGRAAEYFPLRVKSQPFSFRVDHYYSLFIILLPHQVQGTQLHAWTHASWWEAEGRLRCSGRWR